MCRDMERKHKQCRCCKGRKNRFCNLVEVQPGHWRTGTRWLKLGAPCKDANSTLICKACFKVGSTALAFRCISSLWLLTCWLAYGRQGASLVHITIGKMP